MRTRLLEAIASLAVRRPRQVLTTALLLAAAATLLAMSDLDMNANTDDLISPDRPYMRDYRAFLDEFGDLENIYVIVVDPGDVERTRTCVDELTERLRGIDSLPSVHSAIEPEEQLRIALRAMNDEELRELDQVRDALGPIGAANPGVLLADATARLRRLVAVGGLMGDERRVRSGAAAVLELQLIAAALPGSAAAEQLAALTGPREREYLVSETGRLWFIEIEPVKDYGTLAVIAEPLARIREVIAEMRAEYPDLEIGLTGKPVLQADEMSTTDADMTRSSIVAVIAVALLFMLVIGGVRLPLLAVAALLIAIAWTFGVATLVVGQLNLLSIVFTLVLVGIGVDFGVHIITRYREERAHADVLEALRTALVTSGRGNTTGAITSSLAFFMTLFTDFLGLRELGIIAGSGLLLCLVSMTVVLPALMVLTDRGGGGPPRAPRRIGTGPVGSRPRTVLIVAALVTVAAAPFTASLDFEGNLLELQAEDLESVTWEHRVLDDSSSATWFGAAIAEDMDEVTSLVAAANAEPGIGAVHSVLDVIAPTSPDREALRSGLREALDQPLEGTSSGWTASQVREARDALGRIIALARQREEKEAEQLVPLGRDLSRLAVALEREDGAEVRAAVEESVARAEAGVRTMLEGDALPLREALPAAVRRRYVSPGGKYLVSLHPDENVWDVANMERFAAAMRRVAPDVTGVPLTHLESIHDMRDGFAIAALLALAAVVIVMIIDFRSLRDTALASLPLLVGGVWLGLAMSLADIQFNLANFFSVPILIGIGVDDGIHMVHRYREGNFDARVFGSTHRGVFLTSATSMIGFGCLVLASHRGLQSLGLVMALGCLALLASSLVVLPPLLHLLSKRAPKA